MSCAFANRVPSRRSQTTAGCGYYPPPLARATRDVAGRLHGRQRRGNLSHPPHLTASAARCRTRPLVPGGAAPIRANLCDRDRAITLFGRRLCLAVYRRVGVQHASRICHGRAGIQRNGDSKSLGYFVAGRPGFDSPVCVNADAAVAACGDGDSEGDELAGLGI